MPKWFTEFQIAPLRFNKLRKVHIPQIVEESYCRPYSSNYLAASNYTIWKHYETYCTLLFLFVSNKDNSSICMPISLDFVWYLFAPDWNLLNHNDIQKWVQKIGQHGVMSADLKYMCVSNVYGVAKHNTKHCTTIWLFYFPSVADSSKRHV